MVKDFLDLGSCVLCFFSSAVFEVGCNFLCEECLECWSCFVNDVSTTPFGACFVEKSCLVDIISYPMRMSCELLISPPPYRANFCPLHSCLYSSLIGVGGFQGVFICLLLAVSSLSSIAP